MKFKITGKEKTHKFNKHWQFCVESGHAKLAIESEYARQLKKSMKNWEYVMSDFTRRVASSNGCYAK